MLKTNAMKLAIAAVIACCTVASAGWTEVENPNSGIALSPSFNYDSTTGLISIDNVGANGIVDSTDNGPDPNLGAPSLGLQGDDIGMISFQVSINLPNGPLTGPLTGFANGIAWAAPQIFNGKVQLSGNGVLASFLPISADPTPIVQLPTGLTFADFQRADGTVGLEVGANWNWGQPGGTIFDQDAGSPASGNFTVDGQSVPEPATASLLLSAVLAGFGLLRKRS